MEKSQTHLLSHVSHVFCLNDEHFTDSHFHVDLSVRLRSDGGLVYSLPHNQNDVSVSNVQRYQMSQLQVIENNYLGPVHAAS